MFDEFWNIQCTMNTKPFAFLINLKKCLLRIKKKIDFKFFERWFQGSLIKS
jgi:hypothetical protein